MSNPAAGFVSTLKPFVLLCLLFCTSAHAASSWDTQTSYYLELFLKNNPEDLPELNKPAIVDAYRDREYRLLWSNENGWLTRTNDLLHVIVQAMDEGLDPADYYLEDIRKFRDSTAPEDISYLDILLSAALYRYAYDVYSGRFDSRKLNVEWYIQNDALDEKRLFSDVAEKASILQILQALPPHHTGYQLLKQQLRFYRTLAQTGGWHEFTADTVLEPGMQQEQVLQLRRRLWFAGDLLEDALPDSDHYDHELAEAVKRYQTRHGLQADGKVGPQTRRSLNVSADKRIRQIRTNMERWRWMPRTLGNRYLMVNMAGFELYIMDNDVVALTMPVIIGSSYRSTPSFSGLISYMEYNPYWTIPTSLAVEDIVPRQIRDPSFLSKRSIKLFQGWANPQEIDPQTVDWNNLDKDRFPYWLRQEPGPRNALGKIKFIFSNPFEVYLHGTPNGHLFNRVVRNFSSGCIRVKDPVRLAAYLLNDGSQQMEEKVLASIHLGTNRRVSLPVAVPIYLVYMTAWVDQDGNMNFRDDVYGRDARLNQFFGQLADKSV